MSGDQMSLEEFVQRGKAAQDAFAAMKPRDEPDYEAEDREKLRADLLASKQARDDGMAQAKKASRQWVKDACRIICDYSLSHAEFTGDDVAPLIAMLPTKPSDPRAVGPAFSAAQEAGYIRPTDKFIKSRRKSGHYGDIRVWKAVTKI